MRGKFLYDGAQIAANSLESVDFGENNNLAKIGSGSFYNQNHLKSIDFGTENVNDLTIASGAFTGAGNNGYLYANNAPICVIYTNWSITILSLFSSFFTVCE